MRLLRSVVALLLSTFVIFSAASLAPGSPLAAFSSGRTLPADTQAALIERFHLDEPFPVRYVLWLQGVVRGDFGVSVAQRDDVSTLITERIGVTAQLILYAALIVVVIGIGLGILGALRPGLVDSGVLVTTSLLAAIPSFVGAILMIILFVTHLGWFPALGEGEGILDRIRHLTLPAFSLGLSAVAIVARVTRASVRGELARDHVDTAVSRGIPYRQLIRRHVIRNAAVPITTVTGLTIASLLAASAVIERAFSINGLGSYLVRAAASKDIAVVQGISVVVVIVFVVVNLVVDVAHLLLDPRVRAHGEGV